MTTRHSQISIRARWSSRVAKTNEDEREQCVSMAVTAQTDHLDNFGRGRNGWRVRKIVFRQPTSRKTAHEVQDHCNRDCPDADEHFRTCAKLRRFSGRQFCGWRSGRERHDVRRLHERHHHGWRLGNPRYVRHHRNGRRPRCERRQSQRHGGWADLSQRHRVIAIRRQRYGGNDQRSLTSEKKSPADPRGFSTEENP
jgi:hypothetical protein